MHVQVDFTLLSYIGGYSQVFVSFQPVKIQKPELHILYVTTRLLFKLSARLASLNWFCVGVCMHVYLLVLFQYTLLILTFRKVLLFDS